MAGRVCASLFEQRRRERDEPAPPRRPVPAGQPVRSRGTRGQAWSPSRTPQVRLCRRRLFAVWASDDEPDPEPAAQHHGLDQRSHRGRLGEVERGGRPSPRAGRERRPLGSQEPPARRRRRHGVRRGARQRLNHFEQDSSVRKGRSEHSTAASKVFAAIHRLCREPSSSASASTERRVRSCDPSIPDLEDLLLELPRPFPLEPWTWSTSVRPSGLVWGSSAVWAGGSRRPRSVPTPVPDRLLARSRFDRRPPPLRLKDRKQHTTLPRPPDDLQIGFTTSSHPSFERASIAVHAATNGSRGRSRPLRRRSRPRPGGSGSSTRRTSRLDTCAGRSKARTGPTEPPSRGSPRWPIASGADHHTRPETLAAVHSRGCDYRPRPTSAILAAVEPSLVDRVFCRQRRRRPPHPHPPQAVQHVVFLNPEPARSPGPALSVSELPFVARFRCGRVESRTAASAAGRPRRPMGGPAEPRLRRTDGVRPARRG